MWGIILRGQKTAEWSNGAKYGKIQTKGHMRT